MIRYTLTALLLAALPLTAAEDKKPTVPARAKEAAEKVKEKAAEAKEKAAAKKTETPPADADDKALLDHAAKELKKLTPAQTKKLLDLLNDGKPADLQQMPGIGEAKAEAVKKARPFKTADQLIMVDGVGEATFDGIVKWVKDGMKTEEGDKKEAPKKEAPKKEEKKPAAKKEPAPAKK